MEEQIEHTGIEVRIRVIENNKLHVQAQGPKINRAYGVATNIRVPKRFTEWLQKQEHTLPSLAGSKKLYCPALLRLDSSGNCILSVKGEPPLNKQWGAQIRGPSTLLKAFFNA